MSSEINLKEIDLAGFEEKVYVIADEVLNILKELSRENKKQINSKLIAEKMFLNESVKSTFINANGVSSSKEINSLKEMSHTILDKFSELVPSHMTENLGELREIFNNENTIKSAKDWLDSPINVIKKYIDSLSSRNKELEDFLKQTMQSLVTIENPITSELSSQQSKFREDMEFHDSISNYMDLMKEECNISTDIDSLKRAFLSRIENIHKGIEIKREQDMVRLKETEKTIEEMKKRMDEIKREADEIRRKSQEVELATYCDALTGIHNRKAYDERIAETLAHVQRYKIPASLMICDIDFFKKINDTFGHKVGDLALKKLAELLKERLRKNDFIARYGGEEFAIILPHTDLNGAIIAGEGIRAYIAKSVFSYKSQKIPLTISVGISFFRKEDTIDTIFERADQALYAAKKSGRNQIKSENDIVSASPSE